MHDTLPLCSSQSSRRGIRRSGPAAILFACVLAVIVGSSLLANAAETGVEAQHSHSHQHAHTGHEHGHQADDHSHTTDTTTTGHSSEMSVRRLTTQLGVYSLFIATASLFGGWLPTHVQLSHVRFQSLLSVVGGMLLGIGMFHLFPHAVFELGPDRIDFIMQWMMGGIVAMFFLLRTLHVHHHEPEPVTVKATETELHQQDEHHDHAACQHGHNHALPGHALPGHAHPGKLSWAGMFFGLSIHTLLDGLALGASMQADVHHHAGGWVGLGVLAGIVLHKPLDSLSFTTLMINSGQSRWRRLAANLVYSLLCPLGALVFLLGIWAVGEQTHVIVGGSLAFSAGLFLCIALADLLPEMEFHSHHCWRLSLCLVFGIVLAWAIRYLEPAHLHH